MFSLTNILQRLGCLPPPPPVEVEEPRSSMLREISTEHLDREWQGFLDLGADREDLLYVIKNRPFDPHLIERAAATLMALHKNALSVRELNDMLPYIANMPIRVAVGKLVLERTSDIDELAQTMFSVPELQVQVAKMTLDSNPTELHHLMRCLKISEVSDRAFEMLMARELPRKTWRYLMQDRTYGKRAWKRAKEAGIRVGPTESMEVLLDSMSRLPRPTIRH